MKRVGFNSIKLYLPGMKKVLVAALLLLFSYINPLLCQNDYSIILNTPSMEYSYQIDTVWGRPKSLTTETFHWENNTKSLQSRKIIRFKNGKVSQYVVYKKTTKKLVQKPSAGKPQFKYSTQFVLSDSITSARVGSDSVLYFPTVSGEFYPFLLCYKNNQIRELVGFYNNSHPATTRFLSIKPNKRNHEIFDDSGRLISIALLGLNGDQISFQNLTYQSGWKLPVFKKAVGENGCSQEVNELNEKGEVIKIKSLDCNGVLNHSAFINRNQNGIFAGISYKEENLILFDTLFLVNKIKSSDNKTLTEIIVNYWYLNKVSGFYEVSDKLNIFNEGYGIKHIRQGEYRQSSELPVQKSCKAQRIYFNDKGQLIKIEVFFGLPVDAINNGLGNNSPNYTALFSYDEKNNLLVAHLQGYVKIIFTYDNYKNWINKKTYQEIDAELVLSEEIIRNFVYQP